MSRRRVPPVVAVPGSVVAFALLVERAGLCAAVAVTVLVATTACPALTWPRRVAAATAIAAGLAGLFVGLLGQPIPLWPSR